MTCKVQVVKTDHHKIVNILTKRLTEKLIGDNKGYIRKSLSESLWETGLQFKKNKKLF